MLKVMNKIQQIYRKTVKALKERIKTIELNPKYVPNSKQHIKLWSKDKDTNSSFTSDIDDETVTKIMYLNVDKAYKFCFDGYWCVCKRYK